VRFDLNGRTDGFVRDRLGTTLLVSASTNGLPSATKLRSPLLALMVATWYSPAPARSGRVRRG
jgi:hypothetical protein